MRTFAFLLLACSLLLSACQREQDDVPPPQPQVLLKELVRDHLPSPYYRFEYNTNRRITKASFASGDAQYVATYENGRLTELHNTINGERLQYAYDGSDKAHLVKVLNEAGVLYRRAFLEYNAGGRLAKIDWELKLGQVGFAADQTFTFSYYPDGNLEERQNSQYAIEGVQNAAVYRTRFAQYDTGKNVDGFALLHSANKPLLLLPGLILQQNNPKQEVQTGDGVNFTVTYSYTYNDAGYPLHRTGEMVLQNGPQQGQVFPLHSAYSYY